MTKKTLKTILLLVSIPIIGIEYFAFLWFLAGGDIFNLVSTPLVFALYSVVAFLFKKKLKLKTTWNTIAIILIILLVPILTVSTVHLIAFAFGIDVSVA